MRLLFFVLLFAISTNVGSGQVCNGIPEIEINGSNNFDEVAVFGNSYHIMCSLDAIIQLNGETISGQSHTINNFSESDQGTYKCVCHQGMGDPVESKELILVAEPTRMELPMEWLVKEGTTAEFSCGFNFVQSLQSYYQVIWYNVNPQDQRLYSNFLPEAGNSCSKCNITVSKSLIIPNISSEDAQWVYCLVHSVKRNDITINFDGLAYSDNIPVHVLNQTDASISIQTLNGVSVGMVLGSGQMYNIVCLLPENERFTAGNYTYFVNNDNPILSTSNSTKYGLEANAKILKISCEIERTAFASLEDSKVTSVSQPKTFVVLDRPRDILMLPEDTKKPCNRTFRVNFSSKNITTQLFYIVSNDEDLSECEEVMDSKQSVTVNPNIGSINISVDFNTVAGVNPRNNEKLFVYFMLSSHNTSGSCSNAFEVSGIAANQNCIKKLSDPSSAIIGGVVGSLVTLAVVVIVVIVVGLLIWKYRGNYCRRGNDDITLENGKEK